MNKISLISGAGGMDCRILAINLLKKGYKLALTHRRNTLLDLGAHKEFLAKHSGIDNPPINYYVCELTDKNSVDACLNEIYRDFGKIDECYLLAAQSHVGASFKCPDFTVQTNGMSHYYFFDWFYNNSRDTHLYTAMTSELLGGAQQVAYRESDPFDCRSPYSIGKELAYRWTQYYKQLGLFIGAGILFNHSCELRTPDFFIRKVTQGAARINAGLQDSIKLGNLNFARDEHWAALGCEMMWRILQRPEPDIYVVATGKSHTGEQYLEAAFGYFGLNWRDHVEFDESLVRPNEVMCLRGNSEKAQRELGWNPDAISFEEHIGQMCEHDRRLVTDQPIELKDYLERLG